MRWIITLLLFCLIIWIMAALSCQQQIEKLESGVVWNRANASGPVDVIWNPLNPCYTGPCTTFTRVPNYRTSGTPNPAPPTAAYNPYPFCYSCHGSAVMTFGNTTTAIYYEQYNIQHSK